MTHNGKNAQGMIKVHQLNLNKCRQAQVELTECLKKSGDKCIALMQEPYNYKSRMALLPQNMVVIPSSKMGNPRAGMLLSQSLKAKEVTNLIRRDMAVALVNIHGRSTLIASIYLDIKENTITDNLIDLLSYADEKRFALIIGIDGNSRNTVWGHQNNKRGEHLLQFIIDNKLDIVSDGRKDYTFECSTGKSVIDLTLTRGITSNINNWKVSKKLNHSDHNTIHYEIDAGYIDIPEHRPWHKADWEAYKTYLENCIVHIPDEMTASTLESMLDEIYNQIEVALNKACPMTKPTQICKGNPWFTKALQNKRKEVFAKYRVYQNTKSLESKLRYKNLLADYKAHSLKVKLNFRADYKQNLKTEEDMADYMKKLLHKSAPQVGTIKKDDGTYTIPGEETLKAVADKHFAGHSKDIPRNTTNKVVKTEDLEEEYKDWINTSLIRLAFKGFQNKKSPGPDTLRPLVLKHLPQNMLEYIEIVYKATIKLNYNPKQWDGSRVVFIPKPGKEDYTDPKSFRPISLSNYMLKGLERLCGWSVDQVLDASPIDSSQHGFRTGYSTESAISNTVNYIEKFLDKGEYCLGIFLDIAGAFDSICVECIRDSLIKKGCNKDIADWYYKYISSRLLIIQQGEEKYETRCKCGFPQGGVLSAKFWTIAFEGACKIVNSRGMFGQIFADDSGTLIGGKDIPTMYRKANLVLKLLSEWGSSIGLKFNPKKTEVVLFSRDNPAKRKWKTPKIFMDGVEIKEKDEVKYLGVTLDRKLTWKTHIENKIQSAKGMLVKLLTEVRGTFGVKPKLVKYAYTGIIRPKLTYACMTWCNGIKYKYQEDALNSLDRLACRSMTTMLSTTPQASLNIMFDIVPLKLHIHSLALGSFARLSQVIKNPWEPLTRKARLNVPHLWHMEELMEEYEINLPITDLCNNTNYNKSYRVNLDSFDGKRKHRVHAECTMYTDGSKTKSGVGSGLVAYKGKTEIIRQRYKLPDYATVYQAEMYAIFRACKNLNTLDREMPQYIKILSDSQAAILALDNKKITSQLVSDTVYELELLATKTKRITLAWVKAHVGTAGNEAADIEAKEGSKGNNAVKAYISKPKTATKQEINEMVREKWRQRWVESSKYGHTKNFYIGPDKNRAKKVLMHSRSAMSTLVQVITGHNLLSHFQSKQDRTICPMCRFCEEANETFYHFANDCPCLRQTRINIFGSDYLDKNRWKSADLIKLAQHKTISVWLDSMDYYLEEPEYDLDVNYSSDSDID